MTLRFILILILCILTNALYSRDPQTLTETLTGRGSNEFAYKQIKTGEMNFNLKKNVDGTTLLFPGDSISGIKNYNTSTGEPSNGMKWLNAGIIPLGLVTAGLITAAVPQNTLFSKHTVQECITTKYPDFSTTADNYLQFVPGMAVFGLKALGLKSRSDLLNQSIILVKSQLLQMVIVQSLKSITHVERPNGDGYQSMPSGHTAEAFQLAAMLDMEYRDVTPWISVSGYAVATATGTLRMLNNKHWISDVLVGAGIGIFTTKMVYLTHQYRWKMKSNVVILPAIYKNGGGISLAMIL